jgi:hypothetical protein
VACHHNSYRPRADASRAPRPFTRWGGSPQFYSTSCCTAFTLFFSSMSSIPIQRAVRPSASQTAATRATTGGGAGGVVRKKEGCLYTCRPSQRLVGWSRVPHASLLARDFRHLVPFGQRRLSCSTSSAPSVFLCCHKPAVLGE